jgi:hypothetical protein
VNREKIPPQDTDAQMMPAKTTDIALLPSNDHQPQALSSSQPTLALPSSLLRKAQRYQNDET